MVFTPKCFQSSDHITKWKKFNREKKFKLFRKGLKSHENTLTFHRLDLLVEVEYTSFNAGSIDFNINIFVFYGGDERDQLFSMRAVAFRCVVFVIRSEFKMRSLISGVSMKFNLAIHFSKSDL
jgi:hypothetical protein